MHLLALLLLCRLAQLLMRLPVPLPLHGPITFHHPGDGLRWCTPLLMCLLPGSPVHGLPSAQQIVHMVNGSQQCPCQAASVVPVVESSQHGECSLMAAAGIDCASSWFYACRGSLPCLGCTCFQGAAGLPAAIFSCQRRETARNMQMPSTSRPGRR